MIHDRSSIQPSLSLTFKADKPIHISNVKSVVGTEQLQITLVCRLGDGVCWMIRRVVCRCYEKSNVMTGIGLHDFSCTDREVDMLCSPTGVLYHHHRGVRRLTVTHFDCLKSRWCRWNKWRRRRKGLKKIRVDCCPSPSTVMVLK